MFLYNITEFCTCPLCTVNKYNRSLLNIGNKILCSYILLPNLHSWIRCMLMCIYTYKQVASSRPICWRIVMSMFLFLYVGELSCACFYFWIEHNSLVVATLFESLDPSNNRFLHHHYIYDFVLKAACSFAGEEDASSLSGKIIECSWDVDAGSWVCMRIRTDKSTPNDINTYRKVTYFWILCVCVSYGNLIAIRDKSERKYYHESVKFLGNYEVWTRITDTT